MIRASIIFILPFIFFACSGNTVKENEEALEHLERQIEDKEREIENLHTSADIEYEEDENGIHITYSGKTYSFKLPEDFNLEKSREGFVEFAKPAELGEVEFVVSTRKLSAYNVINPKNNTDLLKAKKRLMQDHEFLSEEVITIAGVEFGLLESTSSIYGNDLSYDYLLCTIVDDRILEFSVRDAHLNYPTGTSKEVLISKMREAGMVFQESLTIKKS